MFQSARKARSGEAGFTLVELLVVIAILAVLAGIIVFAVGGIQNQSQNAADKTSCSVLESAEEAYFAQNNAYTDKQSTLVNAGYIHTAGSQTITLTTTPTGNPSYSISGC